VAHLNGSGQFAVGTFAIFFHERGIEAVQQATPDLMDALEGVREEDCAATCPALRDPETVFHRGDRIV